MGVSGRQSGRRHRLDDRGHAPPRSARGRPLRRPRHVRHAAPRAGSRAESALVRSTRQPARSTAATRPPSTEETCPPPWCAVRVRAHRFARRERVSRSPASVPIGRPPHPHRRLALRASSSAPLARRCSQAREGPSTQVSEAKVAEQEQVRARAPGQAVQPPAELVAAPERLAEEVGRAASRVPAEDGEHSATEGDRVGRRSCPRRPECRDARTEQHAPPRRMGRDRRSQHPPQPSRRAGRAVVRGA